MKKLIGLMILCQVMMFAGNLFAASQTLGQKVTIYVPPTLQITGSQNDFMLEFPGTAKGLESNTLTVNYFVSSNGMTQADGAPAVTAQLDGLFEGVELKASVGNYSNESGNTALAPAAGGYVAIRDAATVLAVKANSTGDGKVLHGALPISYKAVAVNDLASGSYTRQLTLTLTDI